MLQERRATLLQHSLPLAVGHEHRCATLLQHSGGLPAAPTHKHPDSEAGGLPFARLEQHLPSRARQGPRVHCKRCRPAWDN